MARRAAAISNLFVKTSQSEPLAALKKKLIEMCKERDKPYGMLVRKLDYPFSAGRGELQALAQSGAQSGGSVRPVSPPVLVYRVYPDGREELVRGPALPRRFDAFSARHSGRIAGNRAVRLRQQRRASGDSGRRRVAGPDVGGRAGAAVRRNRIRRAAGAVAQITGCTAAGLRLVSLKVTVAYAPHSVLDLESAMRLISRTIFREIFVTAMLGAALFTFVLFLQQAGRLFEFLVRTSGPPKTVAYLFAMVRPGHAAVRDSSGRADRHSGHAQPHVDRRRNHRHASRRRSRPPRGPRDSHVRISGHVLRRRRVVVADAVVDPRGNSRQEYSHRQRAHRRVQARVFEEQFPNKVLYVGDVIIGPPSRWRQIFVADVTPPGERAPSASERGDNPSITLAAGSDRRARPVRQPPPAFA